MLVHAHPDDESISTAGVMARYAADGAHVVCVTCTGGEHGEIVVPELDTPENHARLADLRREEIARALAHLGSIDHHWLGYVDSGMMGTPENDVAGSFWQAGFDEAVDRLLAIVREARPQVMVSYNDYGGYGHPDHIRAALITKAAFEKAAGDPSPPLKLYEVAPDFARLEAVRQRAIERGASAWWQPSPDEPDEQRRQREEQMARMAAAQGPVTTRVDVTPFLEAKHRAMREHVTQLAPDFPLVALTPDDWRELMPTEGFTLRISSVGVRIPEDDLFAGLR
jgi:N-acetyl-1-D-myo-inositol-2-amino-2-deoxy-alpha-D-glucopyranoside deacetylase